ncbi:efflux transporter outer membrane subunit [Desulfovibrio gilichinskyi]|uniref:Efflux transporter, outer membrane factor (OMF) lipoprotein, NodT family n=1 Tax=Desulfovibrio gilichinskyi TaxID=1519643 RepID=A0A1X7EJS4_9BACT|nr:efflux transporter outer membrane subunit [Desulfovibrio gilichinskyi]SMF35172.1 efflux transporter, outer membrane factor (OMF) lipoprotein, NodT family [Desulfovibrio gilichinskyi]
MTRFIIYIVSISFLLSGCGPLLRTDFTPPEVVIPTGWNATGNSTDKVTSNVEKWPDSFGDPKLSSLVTLALKRNNNLAAASFRVRQAQIKAGLDYNSLWPQLSGGVAGNNQNNFNKGDWDNSYSTNFDISYEADLWGKLSRTHDSSKWEAEATNEDRLSTALTLVGTTMKLYWKIAYHNVLLDLSKSNIDSSKETLGLMIAQKKFGASSELEVSEAKQDLANLLAEHQSLVQDKQEDLNALAVLFDMPPGKVMADPNKLISTKLPTIPVGLPVELLGRRPDLRAAEMRLRKLLANTDVAHANFYPTLSLTGSLGTSSTELSNFLDNPFAAVASSIAFPFLNWNRLQLNLDESQAEYDEAVVNFRQTLYESMKEVENALSNQKNLTEKGKYLKDNFEAALAVEQIYEVRYKSGFGTLKDWLDSQDTRRKAEEALAENIYNRLVNYINLYQALGGEPEEKDLKNGLPLQQEQHI